MQPPAEAGLQDLVWHYTDGAGLISILANHCLWATSSAFLNDAQEVALGLAGLKTRLRQLALDDETYRLLVDGLDPTDPGALVPSRCYILSAAGAWDLLAMWRLYGGLKESYAIGLDPHARLSVLGDGVSCDDAALAEAGVYLNRRRWEAVRYQPEEQDALIDAVVDGLPARLGDLRAALSPLRGNGHSGFLPEPAWALVRGVLDELEQALVLIKHEGFIDERETRYSIVMTPWEERAAAVDLESRLLSYRATGYGVAPYLRLTGGTDGLAVVDAPAPLPIRAVAISPSPNGSVAEDSVQRLLHSHGYHSVPVLRSQIPYRS